MSYKCKNPKCSQFERLLNPGGIITIKNGKSVFTGSICKMCGKEMEYIPSGLGNFKSINNKDDGRNL